MNSPRWLNCTATMRMRRAKVLAGTAAVGGGPVFMAVLAYIPSPSSGEIRIGPLPLRAYGLLIALGVYAAVVVAGRRYRRRGGDPELITGIAIWAVPAGIIGARLHHAITHYELYTHHLTNIVTISAGGLRIWG